MLDIYKLLTEGNSSERLFQEAGFHDFMKWGTLDIYHACNRLSGLHESLHDEFLTSTPFGAVQQAFIRAQKLSDIKYVVQHSKAWSAELIKQSAETHERVATYLSIKMFSPEKQKKLQLCLHPTYKGFFKDMQDVIEPIFKSSYIQYHVGYAFCELCFASNIAERLTKLDFSSQPCITLNESPNNRFNVLSKRFTEKLLSKLLEYLITCIEQSNKDLQLPSDFSIQSEKSWSELSHNTALRLDRLIEKICCEWFYENSNGMLNSADPDAESRLATVHNFFNHLMASTETNILTKEDNSLQSIITNIDGTPNQDGIAAVKYGKGIIENKPTLRGDKIPLIKDEIQLHDFCNKGAERLILITESGKFDCHPDYSWVSLRFKKDEIEAVRCTHTNLVELLEQLSASTKKPPYDLVIVGIEPVSQKDFEKIKKQVCEIYHLSADQECSTTEYENLIWYLGGNILNWWRTFHNNSTRFLTTLTRYVGLQDTYKNFDACEYKKLPGTLTELGHLGCHIFITEGYPGICIRWMNAVAYEGTSYYFNKEIEKDCLKIIKGKKQCNQLTEKSIWALNAIKNVWSVL